MFCSPDRASRRPRFFGGRRPRPDAGASDQSSPPASRITGAARKQPPGCFVLPSRPSPGIASRFSSPLPPPYRSRRNDRGKNRRWTEDATPWERGPSFVFIWVCVGVCFACAGAIETLFLPLAPSSVFRERRVLLYWLLDAPLIGGRGTPRICSAHVWFWCDWDWGRDVGLLCEWKGKGVLMSVGAFNEISGEWKWEENWGRIWGVEEWEFVSD